MPRSATGICNSTVSRAGGLTLVEVLVVVLIGAILTGVALVRFQPFDAAAGPADEIARLIARLEHACDQALLTGNPRGLEFLPDGYRFRVLEADGWREARTNEAAAARSWPPGFQARVQVDGAATVPGRESGVPQIVCTGVEAPVPFMLELRDSNSAQRLQWP